MMVVATSFSSEDGAPSRKSGLFSEPAREKLRLLRKRFKKTWKIYRRNRLGMLGLFILMGFIFVAVFAPQVIQVCITHDFLEFILRFGGHLCSIYQITDLVDLGLGIEIIRKDLTRDQSAKPLMIIVTQNMP